MYLIEKGRWDCLSEKFNIEKIWYDCIFSQSKKNCKADNNNNKNIININNNIYS